MLQGNFGNAKEPLGLRNRGLLHAHTYRTMSESEEIMSFLEMEGVRQGASPRGSVIKNLPAMQGTRVPCLGEKAPGGGHDNPLQYSCLENSKDRGAWRLQFIGSQRVRHDGSD